MASSNALSLCSTVNTMLPAATSGTSDLVGVSVDISAYDGIGRFSLNFTKTSGTTAGVGRLTDCTTTNGTFADVTGATFPALGNASGITSLAWDLSKLKQFVQVVFLPSGSTPVGVISGTLTAMAKYGA